ncbi:galactose-specific lectin nattectin-like [Scomber japonicus]|uniref:galactose-specific lectin nattectin-like n=1 Tax=Scomber japonicus TaxID=13676 RepID=UPI002306A5F6|nr:galactose-specific lectin nattectin-like [Scomber japonicus]
MASSLYIIVLLCLTSVLGAEAIAKCTKPGHCCEKCPAGWTEVDSRCFMFNFAEKDWSDAEKTCIALGGNLASIRTVEDYNTLREMVNRATGSDKDTWLGGYDAVKEGAWKWSDGSKFEFSGWFKGEPNNARGTEHCMEMNFRGRDYVNDMTCTELKSFICAMDTISEPQ